MVDLQAKTSLTLDQDSFKIPLLECGISVSMLMA